MDRFHLLLLLFIYQKILTNQSKYGIQPVSYTHLHPLIRLCTQLLSDDPLFFLVNSYTTGLAPSVLTYMLATEICPRYKGTVSSEEVGLPVTKNGLVLPCGASGRWSSGK